MSSKSVDVEVVEDIEDEWQRREYLKQIYETLETTRSAIADMQIRGGSQRERHVATVALCDLLRLVEPVIDERLLHEEQIAEVTISSTSNPPGDAPQGAKQTDREEISIVGLTAIYRYEDSDTITLPARAIRSAFRRLTRELHERDLISDRVGEATGEASNPL